MKLFLIPTPGNILVEEILPSKSSIQVETSQDREKQKLLKGVVLAVGKSGITKFGAVVEPPCTVGNQIVFLSYNGVGGYDSVRLEGKSYYIVEFLDVKGVL